MYKIWRGCHLSSVGQSNALVMRGSGVRISEVAPLSNAQLHQHTGQSNALVSVQSTVRISEVAPFNTHILTSFSS